MHVILSLFLRYFHCFDYMQKHSFWLATHSGNIAHWRNPRRLYSLKAKWQFRSNNSRIRFGSKFFWDFVKSIEKNFMSEAFLILKKKRPTWSIKYSFSNILNNCDIQNIRNILGEIDYHYYTCIKYIVILFQKKLYWKYTVE